MGSICSPLGRLELWFLLDGRYLHDQPPSKNPGCGGSGELSRSARFTRVVTSYCWRNDACPVRLQKLAPASLVSTPRAFCPVLIALHPPARIRHGLPLSVVLGAPLLLSPGASPRTSRAPGWTWGPCDTGRSTHWLLDLDSGRYWGRKAKWHLLERLPSHQASTLKNEVAWEEAATRKALAVGGRWRSSRPHAVHQAGPCGAEEPGPPAAALPGVTVTSAHFPARVADARPWLLHFLSCVERGRGAVRTPGGRTALHV